MSPWLSALVALGLLALAGLASAQGAVRDVRIQWLEPLTPGGPVESYVLYRTRLGVEERIELGPGTGAEGCPLLTATVGFLRQGAYSIQLAAVGPGGESERSKPVAVPSCRAAGAPGCAP